MHAMPHSDQFNNNVADVFEYEISKYPQLLFCLCGHGHHRTVNDIFGDGMNYFESLDVTKSNPVFTKVWGEIVCASETTKVVEESAFGEASVKTYTKRTKEWIITGTNTEPYEIGDAATGITIEEVQKAMADREVYLAERKKNAEDYRASQNSSPSPAVANAVPTGNFNF